MPSDGAQWRETENFCSEFYYSKASGATVTCSGRAALWERAWEPGAQPLGHDPAGLGCLTTAGSATVNSPELQTPRDSGYPSEPGEWSQHSLLSNSEEHMPGLSPNSLEMLNFSGQKKRSHSSTSYSVSSSTTDFNSKVWTAETKDPHSS